MAEKFAGSDCTIKTYREDIHSSKCCRAVLGNSRPGALFRGNFRSAMGESSFIVAPPKFSNLSPVEFHAPPVMSREEQVEREMQEHKISAAAAQDKTD